MRTITDPNAGLVEARGSGPVETAEVSKTSWPHGVADDLAYIRTGIVNVYLYGRPGAPSGAWVLIDAGLPGSAWRITRAAEEWMGPWARPAAIVLTHAHFDHVGALGELLRHWDVPVYAHRLELPYLTGRSAYPPTDPMVGGGALAALSRLYPRGPIDLGDWVQPLPENGSLPSMPGWRWIHTPGHSPGHISLFRDEDRTLIAGDAVVTTKQESASAVLAQRPELHGPPAYFTPDWESARRSVEQLAALDPERLATGHCRARGCSRTSTTWRGISLGARSRLRGGMSGSRRSSMRMAWSRFPRRFPIRFRGCCSASDWG
jgi:glyoxylase-like metal-dependent hydrolase (beta-lactamase superfamily II)